MSACFYSKHQQETRETLVSCSNKPIMNHLQFLLCPVLQLRQNAHSWDKSLLSISWITKGLRIKKCMRLSPVPSVYLFPLASCHALPSLLTRRCSPLVRWNADKTRPTIHLITLIYFPQPHHYQSMLPLLPILKPTAPFILQTQL